MAAGACGQIGPIQVTGTGPGEAWGDGGGGGDWPTITLVATVEEAGTAATGTRRTELPECSLIDPEQITARET